MRDNGAAGVDRSASASALVVLLHGLGTDSSIWDRTRENLEGHPESIAVDYLSADPALNSFDFGHAVDAVRVAVARAQARSVILVGLSLGGMVAQRYAIDHPDEVAGLILISTNFLATPDEIRTLSAQRADRIERQGTSEIGIELAERWLGERIRSTDPTTYAKYAEMVRATPAGTFVSAFRAIADSHYTGPMPPFSCPVLVVVSEGDPPTSHRASEELHLLIPGSQFVLVTDAGHFSPLEKPAELAEAVVKFSRTLASFAPGLAEGN